MTNAIAPSMRRLALLALLLAALPAAAQEVILRGALSPATAVSPTESKGTGEVAAVLGEDNVLRLDMIFAGVDPGASRAALHIGKYNETGPMQQRLDIDEGATSGRLESVEISLTPLTAASVRAGESYV
ncbi:MAG: hypothetical protein H0W24_06605, partial [Lysobacter sp.]|nr:hypothetical protein [Lysobacter sp.]